MFRRSRDRSVIRISSPSYIPFVSREGICLTESSCQWAFLPLAFGFVAFDYGAVVMNSWWIGEKRPYVCMCMYVSRIAIMGWDSCHRAKVASPSSSSAPPSSTLLRVCVCAQDWKLLYYYDNWCWWILNPLSLSCTARSRHFLLLLLLLLLIMMKLDPTVTRAVVNQQVFRKENEPQVHPKKQQTR